MRSPRWRHARSRVTPFERLPTPERPWPRRDPSHTSPILEAAMAARKRNGPDPRPPSPRHLPVVQPDAAGIDVGSAEHWVAVAPDRDPRPVRRFAAFTADLGRLADWLA